MASAFACFCSAPLSKGHAGGSPALGGEAAAGRGARCFSEGVSHGASPARAAQSRGIWRASSLQGQVGVSRCMYSVLEFQTLERGQRPGILGSEPCDLDPREGEDRPGHGVPAPAQRAFALGWAVALIRAPGSAEPGLGAALTPVAGWGCGQMATAGGHVQGPLGPVRLAPCSSSAWPAGRPFPRPGLAARVLGSESVS